jgi:hypothetical protein
MVKSLPPAHPLATSLVTLNLSLSDLYLPTPNWVKQSEFFCLMRRARFFLAFNRIPESFGLMPLECVMQGCPVYTNGSGNLRFLLPKSHGIHIEDSQGLNYGNSQQQLRLAQLVYRNVVQLERSGPSTIRDELSRGQEFIREHYSREKFFRSFASVLDRQRTALPSHHDLGLSLNATVRQWNAGSGCMLTDFGNHSMELEHTKTLERLLGRNAADLFEHATSREQSFISELWQKGLLTWQIQN